jgi:hypothetical protein
MFQIHSHRFGSILSDFGSIMILSGFGSILSGFGSILSVFGSILSVWLDSIGLARFFGFRIHNNIMMYLSRSMYYPLAIHNYN